MFEFIPTAQPSLINVTRITFLHLKELSVLVETVCEANQKPVILSTQNGIYAHPEALAHSGRVASRPYTRFLFATDE